MRKLCDIIADVDAVRPFHSSIAEIVSDLQTVDEQWRALPCYFAATAMVSAALTFFACAVLLP